MADGSLDGTTWEAYAVALREEQEPRSDIPIKKEWVTHPKDLGLVERAGIPDGQQANYRASLTGWSGCIHIKEYEDHFKMHWDEVDPDDDLFGHTIVDGAKYVVPIVALFLIYHLQTE